jgi:hypothetical protein
MPIAEIHLVRRKNKYPTVVMPKATAIIAHNGVAFHAAPNCQKKSATISEDLDAMRPYSIAGSLPSPGEKRRYKGSIRKNVTHQRRLSRTRKISH